MRKFDRFDETKDTKIELKPAGRERHARIAQARTNEAKESVRGTSANSHALHIVDPSNDPLRKVIHKAKLILEHIRRPVERGSVPQRWP